MSFLTVEKLQDKRFFETEKAIFYAYWNKDLAQVEQLIAETNISRATFYRHHQALLFIERDYEKVLEAKIQSEVQKINPETSLRRVYFDFLITIYKHRPLFNFFYQKSNVRVYAVMLETIQPIVVRANEASKHIEVFYGFYTWNVIGAIQRWGEAEFSDERLINTLDEIMYLTRNAGRGLSGIKPQAELGAKRRELPEAVGQESAGVYRARAKINDWGVSE